MKQSHNPLSKAKKLYGLKPPSNGREYRGSEDVAKHRNGVRFFQEVSDGK